MRGLSYDDSIIIDTDPDRVIRGGRAAGAEAGNVVERPVGSPTERMQLPGAVGIPLARDLPVAVDRKWPPNGNVGHRKTRWTVAYSLTPRGIVGIIIGTLADTGRERRILRLRDLLRSQRAAYVEDHHGAADRTGPEEIAQLERPPREGGRAIRDPERRIVRQRHVERSDKCTLSAVATVVPDFEPATAQVFAGAIGHLEGACPRSEI